MTSERGTNLTLSRAASMSPKCQRRTFSFGRHFSSPAFGPHDQSCGNATFSCGKTRLQVARDLRELIGDIILLAWILRGIEQYCRSRQQRDLDKLPVAAWGVARRHRGSHRQRRSARHRPGTFLMIPKQHEARAKQLRAARRARARRWRCITRIWRRPSGSAARVSTRPRTVPRRPQLQGQRSAPPTCAFTNPNDLSQMPSLFQKAPKRKPCLPISWREETAWS